VWSDLHYAEADRALPAEQRRIVLTVQKAIFTPSRAAGTPLLNDEGALLGVVRAGLLTRDLDAIAQLKVDPESPDPQRVALVALAHSAAPTAAGRPAAPPLRLVTRPSAADRLEPIDGELRVTSAALPPELAALLSSPLAARFASYESSPDPGGASSSSASSSASPPAAGPRRDSDVLDVGGTRWRVSLTALPPATGGIDGWAVAVLVAEEHYTRALAATQRGVIIAFAITLAVLVAIGGGALLLVRRDLARIVAATARMHGFDFRPAVDRSLFRDVDDAMSGLERAKTVVRAMGKYIPMDLVRRLYAANTEPKLGGELAEVSILFTDIEGFTTLAEKLPVTELAQQLGAYLEVMTDAIEAEGGTIDKYIGDAVMALWNAPTAVPEHATRACAAALACIEAVDALYASPRWAGLPPLVTRFGLHKARVLVGHFGAPSRLSYTALGDGVNLAARLEPLCKQYCVRVLVSEDVAEEARAAFRFRRLDRVAVKGKQRGIEIFELCGPIGVRPDEQTAARHAAYDAAFAAYLARDFAGAAARLAPHVDDDPPAAALAARCQRLAAAPPPEDWDGVHVASSK
jgi:adenylate cyclase